MGSSGEERRIHKGRAVREYQHFISRQAALLRFQSSTLADELRLASGWKLNVERVECVP